MSVLSTIVSRSLSRRSIVQLPKWQGLRKQIKYTIYLAEVSRHLLVFRNMLFYYRVTDKSIWNICILRNRRNYVRYNIHNLPANRTFLFLNNFLSSKRIGKNCNRVIVGCFSNKLQVFFPLRSRVKRLCKYVGLWTCTMVYIEEKCMIDLLFRILMTEELYNSIVLF